MKECTNIPIEVQTLLMRIVSKLSILERCSIECRAIRSLKKSQEVARKLFEFVSSLRSKTLKIREILEI